MKISVQDSSYTPIKKLQGSCMFIWWTPWKSLDGYWIPSHTAFLVLLWSKIGQTVLFLQCRTHCSKVGRPNGHCFSIRNRIMSAKLEPDTKCTLSRNRRTTITIILLYDKLRLLKMAFIYTAIKRYFSIVLYHHHNSQLSYSYAAQSLNMGGFFLPDPVLCSIQIPTIQTYFIRFKTWFNVFHAYRCDQRRHIRHQRYASNGTRFINCRFVDEKRYIDQSYIYQQLTSRKHNSHLVQLNVFTKC